jgi:hypothetical protein
LQGSGFLAYLKSMNEKNAGTSCAPRHKSKGKKDRKAKRLNPEKRKDSCPMMKNADKG